MVSNNSVSFFDFLGLEPSNSRPSRSKPYKKLSSGKRKALRLNMKKCIAKEAKKMKDNNKKCNCADVFVTAVAKCAEKYNVPLTFKVWDAKRKKYIEHGDTDYKSTDDFIKNMRDKMNALTVIDNTKPQEWKSLEVGDVMMYDLRSHNNPGYTGHTMVITGKYDTGSETKWTTVEGHTGGARLTEGKYTKKEFKSKGGWGGPADGKGRYLDWRNVIK